MNKTVELYTKALEIITNEQERIAVGKLIGEIIELESGGKDYIGVVENKDPELMTPREREDAGKRLNDLVTLKILNLQLLQTDMQMKALKKDEILSPTNDDVVRKLEEFIELARVMKRYTLMSKLARIMQDVQDGSY